MIKSHAFLLDHKMISKVGNISTYFSISVHPWVWILWETHIIFLKIGDPFCLLESECSSLTMINMASINNLFSQLFVDQEEKQWNIFNYCKIWTMQQTWQFLHKILQQQKKILLHKKLFLACIFFFLRFLSLVFKSGSESLVIKSLLCSKKV